MNPRRAAITLSANNPFLATERPPGFLFRQLGQRKTGGSALLHCEDVPLVELAKRYGTPLYVYSSAAILTRLCIFEDAFGHFPHTICYSVKANSNLNILRLLARIGCGFDVVSGGELERVLKADRRAAKKTVFSGVGKSRDEMIAALKAGILLFNVESESELSVLGECAAGVRKEARLALRVNPDVDARTHPYISTGLHKHKFGVPIANARGLYARAARMKYVKVTGVSVHIGSQITEIEPFAEAVARVADFIRQLREDGHRIDYVDIGGGVGIAYERQEIDFARHVAKYARGVTHHLRELTVHLLLEPGRAIVGPAGVLLTSVLYRKRNNGKRFLVVDAAMNDLIRPALYGAYHEIVPVSQKLKPDQAREVVDVVGPVCESGDFLGRDRNLPHMEEGDLLAVMDAGAYGMALASNYNTRPRPAEVLVNGRSAKLIRKREKVSDLFSAEL
ncbi:MAG TPA: diaminopimelate decarboxylase [Candidatus Aquilonibacter sp.]|nr:diaminopimelate decarboxylase [Candidatus Aquilonibacter sp.]